VKLKPAHIRAAILLAALLLDVWGIAGIVREAKTRRWLRSGPIGNHPVRIYDVNFQKEFNDLNDTQLAVAQALGVPPVEDREAADKQKSRLVQLQDCEGYVIDSLTHSIPFLIPSAKALLDRIGTNFLDSLASKGLNPNRLVVTSVLRTESDVRSLRKGNINASENSTHRYGTTFDLSYWHYVKVPSLRGRPYEDVPPEYLRATLSQVLKDLHDEGACYVKYEKKQSCFHITTRK